MSVKSLKVSSFVSTRGSHIREYTIDGVVSTGQTIVPFSTTFKITVTPSAVINDLIASNNGETTFMLEGTRLNIEVYPTYVAITNVDTCIKVDVNYSDLRIIEPFGLVLVYNKITKPIVKRTRGYVVKSYYQSNYLYKVKIADKKRNIKAEFVYDGKLTSAFYSKLFHELESIKVYNDSCVVGVGDEYCYDNCITYVKLPGSDKGEVLTDQINRYLNRCLDSI